MKRFIEGANRDQGSLFPVILEDYVSENNPVMVIEAFIEKYNHRHLGLLSVDHHAAGRPSCKPETYHN